MGKIRSRKLKMADRWICKTAGRWLDNIDEWTDL